MYDWHIISLIRPLDLTESHPAGLCVVFNNARCILGDTCLLDSVFHHTHSNHVFQARKNKGVYIQWAFRPAFDTKQPVLVNKSRMWHSTSTVGLLLSSAPVVFSKLLVNWYYIYYLHMFYCYSSCNINSLLALLNYHAPPLLSASKTHKPCHSCGCYDTADMECFHMRHAFAVMWHHRVMMFLICYKSYGSQWTTVTFVTFVWTKVKEVGVHTKTNSVVCYCRQPYGWFWPGMLWMVMARMRRRIRRQLLPVLPTSSCCLLPVSCPFVLPEWGPLLLW